MKKGKNEKMLTQEWLKKQLPNEIKSEKDVELLIEFLKQWSEKANDPDALYKFVSNMNKETKKELQNKLKTLIESYLDWLINKQTKLDIYVKQNGSKLSANTLKELLSFFLDDAEKNKHTLSAIRCVYKIISI